MPSSRAKARVLRDLREMAAKADAIQTLGPYAVTDALRAITAEEANETRIAVATVTRLMARFAEAWRNERGDVPEHGQQSMPVAA